MSMQNLCRNYICTKSFILFSDLKKKKKKKKKKRTKHSIFFLLVAAYYAKRKWDS